MNMPSSAPAKDFKSISGHDVNRLTGYTTETITTRFISVGVTGDVAIKNGNGDTVVIGLAAGVLHPIVTNQIMATGTDATEIIIYW